MKEGYKNSLNCLIPFNNFAILGTLVIEMAVHGYICLLDRFISGVAHSFTGSAEDRDRLLSFENLFIGDDSIYHYNESEF